MSSNQNQTPESDRAALQSFLRSRQGGKIGAQELLVGKTIKTLVGGDFRIDCADHELAALARSACLSDLALYPTAWSRTISQDYKSLFPGLHDDESFRETVVTTLKDKLQDDIKTAGYGFLYAYLNSAHNVLEDVGFDTQNEDYKQTLADALYVRLESDLAKGSVQGVDDLLYDINRTLGLHHLAIKSEHRVALTALVTSNGLSMLNASFTDSAQKDAPDNKNILESTLNGLRLIRSGHDGQDIGEVRRVLDEAFERALVREAELSAVLKSDAGNAGAQVAPSVTLG